MITWYLIIICMIVWICFFNFLIIIWFLSLFEFIVNYLLWLFVLYNIWLYDTYLILIIWLQSVFDNYLNYVQVRLLDYYLFLITLCIWFWLFVNIWWMTAFLRMQHSSIAIQSTFLQIWGDNSVRATYQCLDFSLITASTRMVCPHLAAIFGMPIWHPTDED